MSRRRRVGNTTVHHRIRSWRLRSGCTRFDLADAIKATQWAIYRIERGDVAPSAEQVEEIAARVTGIRDRARAMAKFYSIKIDV